MIYGCMASFARKHKRFIVDVIHVKNSLGCTAIKLLDKEIVEKIG